MMMKTDEDKMMKMTLHFLGEKADKRLKVKMKLIIIKKINKLKVSIKMK